MTKSVRFPARKAVTACSSSSSTIAANVFDYTKGGVAHRAESLVTDLGGGVPTSLLRSTPGVWRTW